MPTPSGLATTLSIRSGDRLGEIRRQQLGDLILELRQQFLVVGQHDAADGKPDHQDRHQGQEREVRHRPGELTAQPVAVPGDRPDQVLDALARSRSACRAGSTARSTTDLAAPVRGGAPLARRRAARSVRRGHRASCVETARAGTARDRPVVRQRVLRSGWCAAKSVQRQPRSKPTLSYTAATVASATCRARTAPAASTRSSSPGSSR